MTQAELTVPGSIQQNVLIGLDGYLFLHNGGQRQFDYLTGFCQPTATDVENFFTNIDSRQRFCEQRGIDYLHIVFPSKPVVMQDKVPSPWREQLQSLYLQQYAARVTTELPAHLLYPLPLLTELAGHGLAYPKHDTHNTMHSMLLITQSILQRFSLDYDPAQYFVARQTSKLGDLGKMLGLLEKEPEIIPNPTFSPLILDNLSALPANTNNICIIYNKDATSTRRLLIFGDSFIKMALIFFSPVFRDIVYLRCTTFQPELVEMYAPDLVISSNAERYLSTVDSDQQSASFLLQLYGEAKYQPDAAFSAALKAQFSYRYHPTAYKKWCISLLPGDLTADVLGNGVANQQIKILDKATGFYHAADNDPCFVFGNTELQQGKNYRLEFDLSSEFATYVKVYFTESNDDSGFTESRSKRAKVAVGFNRISLILDSAILAPQLRIDPTACAGHFVLNNLRVTEIPIA